MREQNNDGSEAELPLRTNNLGVCLSLRSLSLILRHQAIIARRTAASNQRPHKLEEIFCCCCCGFVVVDDSFFAFAFPGFVSYYIILLLLAHNFLVFLKS